MLRRLILALSFLLCLPCPCRAQGVLEHERALSEDVRPASDSHSYVELFTKLERTWIQAVQKKDEAALNAILAPEFILRTSENPENPVPRNAWVQHALTRYDTHSVSQQSMAIRAFLGVAVVSFIQNQQEIVDGEDCIDNYLIVDLWEVNHNQWQVAARYISLVSKQKL